MSTMGLKNRYATLAFAALLSGTLQAQDPPAPSSTSAEEVAKKLQNPVANVISIPLQSNFNFGFGPEEKMQLVLNVQPVVPVKLSEKLLLINRPILPVVSNPSPFGQSGISDLNYTGWFSPAKAGAVTWGAGPTLSFPIASPEELGNGQWCIGPSAVVVKSAGKWVFGGLASNIFNASDSEDHANVNFLSSQVFVNYNLKKGSSLNFAPLITANWEAPEGEQWTVPLGAGVAQVLPVGRIFMNIGLQYYVNVVHPTIGPTSSFRFQIALAIPK